MEIATEVRGSQGEDERRGAYARVQAVTIVDLGAPRDAPLTLTQREGS